MAVIHLHQLWFVIIDQLESEERVFGYFLASLPHSHLYGHTVHRHAYRHIHTLQCKSQGALSRRSGSAQQKSEKANDVVEMKRTKVWAETQAKKKKGGVGAKRGWEGPMWRDRQLEGPMIRERRGSFDIPPYQEDLHDANASDS